MRQFPSGSRRYSSKAPRVGWQPASVAVAFIGSRGEPKAEHSAEGTLHTENKNKMTQSSDTMKHEITRKKFSVPSNFHDAKDLKLNKLKVRTEGSAMVLASIILLFLIAHSFRLAFKIYEKNLASQH